MSLRLFFRSTLLLLLTLVGSLSYAAPMLNGIATHQELGRDQFLGALYSETLSNDADTIINSHVAKRMELKIVSPDGMPTRRFGRMWIEGMAINNNNELLTAQADNMVKFDGLFKGKLLANDHIVFAVTPDAGVNISVNGVLLGNIANDQFFEMLLRTWIGRVPLSSTYRDALLKAGKVSDDIRARYEGINFTSARATTIAAWTAPAKTEKEVVAAKEPTPKAEPKVVIETPKVSVPAIAAPKIELPTLSQPDSPEPTVSATEPASQSVPASPTTPVEVSTSEPTIAAIPAVEDEDEDYEPALTAQSLLARQFYVSDILKKIRSKTEYPRRAAERNQEGSMRISIKVDRAGNIQEMSWLEESRYSLLNKEAWEAVKRSGPFPAIPDAIPGRSFEFTAPISFEMAK